MQKLNTKVILFGGIGAFVLFIVLVISGVIPGLKKSGVAPVSGSLVIWTVEESSAAEKNTWVEILKKFKEAYPNITVTQKDFDSYDAYENALLDGLASGEGPDIFMVLNQAVPRYANKIYPAPETVLPLSDLRARFPKVVEQDFAPQGKIYGIPFSVDTLVLIYHRGFLDQEAVTPPQSWEEFEAALPRLTKSDVTGISFAGAALGTAENVEHPEDILSLLLLQTGVAMTNSEFTRATFNTKEAEGALKFYTQFADAASSAYTWNASLPESLDMFTQEKVAMILGYNETIKTLKERNPFIDIGVSEVPSPASLISKNKKISYPRYYGFSVSRQSKNPDLAWLFLTSVVGNDTFAGDYMVKTKKPPALRSLLVMNKDDANIGVFARQALVAVSWPQIDNRLVERLFTSAITRVSEGQTAPETAIKETVEEISRAMEKKF